MTDFYYEPQLFLRCHSRNNDPADVQTKVWQCAFEPNKPEHLALLATCGGDSLCVIQPDSSKVIAKLIVDPQLFALSWATVSKKSGDTKVLVTGGSIPVLYVFDPIRAQLLLEFRLRKKINSRKDDIYSLVFHPKIKKLFFCGSMNGTIDVCELISSDNDELQINLLSSISLVGEILCQAFDIFTNCLFTGTTNGLYVTRFVDFKRANKYKTDVFRLPARSQRKDARDDGDIVDSVEVLSEGLIAVKYALHGRIYICDINDAVGKLGNSKETIELFVHQILIWSSTDNFYMNLGVSKDLNLLGCGDDRGDIWLYDLNSAIKSLEDTTDPINILRWPELEDCALDKKRKLRLDVYDIVINHVAISSGRKFIAAVTNNNMVCLWRSREGSW